jgi:hypothetical protein
MRFEPSRAIVVLFIGIALMSDSRLHTESPGMNCCSGQGWAASVSAQGNQAATTVVGCVGHAKCSQSWERKLEPQLL